MEAGAEAWERIDRMLVEGAGNMARGKKSQNNNRAKLGFEEQLWAMADATISRKQK